MKLKTFLDNDYNKIIISNKLNNGDWDYWLVIRLTYLAEYLTEEELKNTGKYQIEILAVSLEAAKDKVKDALYSMGLENEIKVSEDLKIESLLEYGIYATLWSNVGNNKTTLIKQAKEEILPIETLLGFYMDKAENRLGNTGWDFISGNIGLRIS
jgi:hypothetical protein